MYKLATLAYSSVDRVEFGFRKISHPGHLGPVMWIRIQKERNKNNVE